MAVNKKHIGGSFDDFLNEEKIYHDVMQTVTKKRLALQFEREMKKRKITKTQMAHRLHTSRAQVNRILSPDNASVSVESIAKAAEVLGCRLKIDLERISVSKTSA